MTSHSVPDSVSDSESDSAQTNGRLVRTRVAPSPTGDPHVGTAYVALFNYCFARQQGGQFVLRIEDTDQARSTARSETQIFESLKWLGISWDEGPDVGGPHGSYRQSERKDIYAEHAQKLIDEGHAFHCFCSSERLTALRAEQMAEKRQPGYDGLCQGLSADEISQRITAGESHVVRMNVPRTGEAVFQDRLRGEISIPWSQIDMQVIVKADGMPTYHLAAVVDDRLMGITHILRGEEWINSVPKHLLLHEYFGWDMPELVHLPLLRNPDKSKLSKRKNPTSVNYFRDAGFLPEALLNFLGLMGFSMPDERDQFTLEELVSEFDIDRISLGSPVFDLEKLSWLNGQWIRDLDEQQFAGKIADWALNESRLRALVPLVKDRIERLDQLAPMVDYLLGDRKALTAEDFAHKHLQPEDIKKILQFSLWQLEAASEQFEADQLQPLLAGMAERMDLKIRDFLAPLFIAITGKAVSLPLFDSMVFLGADVTRMRLRDAIDVLGGVGKKLAKKLEKEYQQLNRG